MNARHSVSSNFPDSQNVFILLFWLQRRPFKKDPSLGLLIELTRSNPENSKSSERLDVYNTKTSPLIPHFFLHDHLLQKPQCQRSKKSTTFSLLSSINYRLRMELGASSGTSSPKKLGSKTPRLHPCAGLVSNGV